MQDCELATRCDKVLLILDLVYPQDRHSPCRNSDFGSELLPLQYTRRDFQEAEVSICVLLPCFFIIQLSLTLQFHQHNQPPLYVPFLSSNYI